MLALPPSRPPALPPSCPPAFTLPTEFNQGPEPPTGRSIRRVEECDTSTRQAMLRAAACSLLRDTRRATPRALCSTRKVLPREALGGGSWGTKSKLRVGSVSAYMRPRRQKTPLGYRFVWRPVYENRSLVHGNNEVETLNDRPPMDEDKRGCTVLRWTNAMEAEGF